MKIPPIDGSHPLGLLVIGACVFSMIVLIVIAAITAANLDRNAPSGIHLPPAKPKSAKKKSK